MAGCGLPGDLPPTTTAINPLVTAPAPGTILTTPEPTGTDVDASKAEEDITSQTVEDAGNGSGIAIPHLPEDVPDIIIDPSMHIFQVSASYLALNGLPPIDVANNQYVGLNIFDFIETRRLVPGPDWWKTIIDGVMIKQCAYATTDIDSAGRTFWCLRAAPTFENGKLVCIDVNAQTTMAGHQIESSIDQLDANNTYRILVETVKDYAIFMLDIRGNVKTWNTGAALLKGYKPEEIIGRHFSTFYGDEDIKAQKPQKELEVCLREGKVEDESWRYRKDGSRFWANVTITCVYRDGVHIGFSKVTRDLTERKAAESRVISAYEESAKLKSAFLANMSHEIRTPMHGMLTALTLLMDLPLTQDQRKLGEIIAESGTVLLQVINDILDYSKLSSGAFSISLAAFSISDTITSIMRSVQPTLKHEVSMETLISSGIPTSANGDPLRYRQIVQNLVANSAKFTDAGSIVIDASVMYDDEDSSTILTEVIDTGIGIPSHAVSSLFTPFTQSDNSTTKLYKGTGLGLSICKSLAELMGGKIGFRENPNTHGSIFWFTTKVYKISKPKQVNKLEDQAGRAGLSLPDSMDIIKDIAPKKHLLLVEDNIINQKVMLRMLKSLGFEQVDTAIEGATAVRTVKGNPQLFDLILMDISMPVLDGMGATREIRNAGLKMPIIAVTANALKGNADMCLAHGMDGYIPKPVNRKLLVQTLLTWLKP